MFRLALIIAVWLCFAGLVRVFDVSIIAGTVAALILLGGAISYARGD